MPRKRRTKEKTTTSSPTKRARATVEDLGECGGDPVNLANLFDDEPMEEEWTDETGDYRRDDRGTRRRRTEEFEFLAETDETLKEFYETLKKMELQPEAPADKESENGHNDPKSKPRLIIESIVLENFKSYHGVVRIGPFHKNFTAVIGPNGSGKSNVIDALLFVFGYRSQQIRSKNAAALIHTSERHPNVKYCMVEVQFVKIIDRHDGTFEEVPNSTTTVGRKVYKDGAQESPDFYYIDDKNKHCYQREIHAWLRSNGIDIDRSRFLILQGEIEQIALMKPRSTSPKEVGMVEYLEDIIGSSRYKPMITELETNMDVLGEMKSSQVEVTERIEDERDALKEPMKVAVEILNSENNLTRMKNQLWQRQILDCGEENKRIEDEYDQVEIELNGQKAESIQLLEEIETEKVKIDNMKRTRVDAQKELDKQLGKLEELRRNDAKLIESLRQWNTRRNEWNAELVAETNKLSELEPEPDIQRRKCEKLQADLNDLENRRLDAETRLREGLPKVEQETMPHRRRKDELEQELAVRQSDVLQAREKLRAAEDELKLHLSGQKKEAKKLDELRENLRRVTNALKDGEKNIREAEESIPAMVNEFDQLERQLRETETSEGELREVVSNKSNRIDTVRRSMQQNQNRKSVVSALFEQQRQGRLSGIFGRLGDLGAIDEKYDVAISTACGALDNIVVDTIDTAQQCVEFLTANNIGRTTFIGLDKMTRTYVHKMMERYPRPENLPRLFDFIRVDDNKFLPAFYSGIRNTLVAENLEQAKRAAYRRDGSVYRTVTLNGELIDSSGTMSGGGTPSKGRMGHSVRSPSVDDMTPDELKRLEDELAAQRKRLEELGRSKRRMNDDRERIGSELQRKRAELNQWIAERKAYEEQKDLLEPQIVNQEAVLVAATPDETEKKRLEAEVEKLANEFEQVGGASKVIRDEIEMIDNIMSEIKKNIVGHILGELDIIRREVGNTEKLVNTPRLAENIALRAINSCKEKMTALENDIANSTGQCQAIVDQINNGEESILQASDICTTFRTNISSLEEELRQAKDTLDKLKEHKQQLKAAIFGTETKLKKLDKAMSSMLEKLAYWNDELKKLRLHDLRSFCGGSATSAQQRSARHGDAGGDDGASGDEEMEVEQDGDGDHSNGHNHDDAYSTELKTHTEAVLRGIDKNRLALRVTVLEELHQDRRADLDVLKEYRRKAEKYKTHAQKLLALTVLHQKYRERLTEVQKRRFTEFMEGFKFISASLIEAYQMLTLGGNAELTLVEPLDPFKEGIAFSVRPPEKSWKQIAMLSGGEKTLSSLALVFALHRYKPSPFYVMDEIDAALDPRNVSITSLYLKERTKDAQFIVISLRDNMFVRADRLVGVFKVKECSRTVVCDPAKICAQA